MPTQAEIDAAKAAKEKKNSNNIVVASGGEAHFSDGKVYGDAKVVGTSGPGGFDHGIKATSKTFTQPGQEGEVHDSWDDTKKKQNAYQLKLAAQHEASGSGGSDSGKKPGGTKSYQTAYDEAGGAAKLGDYAKWEKKAKDWNTKKYGTTEPTAKAAKFTGGSKTKLAEAAKPVKMERKEATPIATSTPNNNRMQRTIANANNPASLVGGTQTRREKRQADRKINRDNKAANKLRHVGQKATTQRTNKETRQDTRQQRSDKRFERKTGINMSGTPSSSPQLDTGPGTYQGAKKAESEKKKNWRSSLSNKTFGM